MVKTIYDVKYVKLLIMFYYHEFNTHGNKKLEAFEFLSWTKMTKHPGFLDVQFTVG